MIGLLQGIVFYKNDPNIIIMVNGVGYKAEVVSKLITTNIGDEITAYIYTHVREDAIKLFGFSSEEELQVFEMLLGVSGVGPKGAMNIISTLGIDAIYDAVIMEDPKIFKAVSGIGGKNSEKIIIELKSKIKKEIREKVDTNSSGQITGTRHELESALITLGYSIAEIKNVEKDIEYSDNTSQMVRQALQLLNRI